MGTSTKLLAPSHAGQLQAKHPYMMEAAVFEWMLLAVIKAIPP